MTTNKPLARFVGKLPTSAQRERNWDAIRTRLPHGAVRSRQRPAVIFGLAFAVFLVALAPFAWRLRSAGSIQGATLETGDNEQETVTLGDGSRVVLDESTRVRLASLSARQVRLELDHGGLEADVTHVDGRSFVVAVGAIEVVVIGTHFEVQTDGDGPARTLRVSVARGRVEVRRPGEAARFVGAGESWSGPLVAPMVEPSAHAAPPHVADAGVSHPVVVSAPRFRPSREFRDAVAAGRYADAYAALGIEGLPQAMKSAQPQDLFEIAQVTRYAGHQREAATAFEAFVGRFPNDSRAGVCALELGRLRMTDLSDPSGAVAAFGDAIDLVPAGPLREDAAARRVQALEATGELAACAAARDEYLATYPGGTHALTVARRCLGP